MKKLLVVFLALFVHGCGFDMSYPEYKLAPLPENISQQYLQNATAYLAIATAEESVIDQTLSRNTQVQHKLMTFPREKLRVLMVYDLAKNTQSINIASLQNAYDITKNLHSYYTQSNIFPFQLSKYYKLRYDAIREEIISTITPGAIVQINAIGSATAYATLLALELRQFQVPVETIINLGSTRFASQDIHAKIATQFEGVMVNITHENDINHEMYMGFATADSLPNEYVICSTKNCHETIREQRYFFKGEIRRHISSLPRQYIEMYRTSLTQIKQ